MSYSELITQDLLVSQIRSTQRVAGAERMGEGWGDPVQRPTCLIMLEVCCSCLRSNWGWLEGCPAADMKGGVAPCSMGCPRGSGADCVLPRGRWEARLIRACYRRGGGRSREGKGNGWKKKSLTSIFKKSYFGHSCPSLPGELGMRSQSSKSSKEKG